MNLVNNGVHDDWEIFLQWRDSGYVVVPESQRQPPDARLGYGQAVRLLDTITGGIRAAPGLANDEALVQAMYESQTFETPRAKNQ